MLDFESAATSSPPPVARRTSSSFLSSDDTGGGTLKDLLDFPRSTHGDVALASLESLVKSWKKRDEALLSMELCKDSLLETVLRGIEVSRKRATCADPFNSKHAATVSKWGELFRKKAADVNYWYAQFTESDESAVGLQRQISSAYDSYRTRMLQIEANEELQRLRDEQIQREIDERAMAERKPLDEFSRTSLADFFHNEIRCGSTSEGDLIARNPRAAKVLAIIVKFQARTRGARRRRQLAALWRSRNICDSICMRYQLYMWRAHVRGEVFRRKRFFRIIFVGLQANANTSMHRRSGFALHFARSRELATMFRVFVMWRRYNQWLRAAVDPSTHERILHFEYTFDAWDEFLHERKQLAIQRNAAIRFGERVRATHPFLVQGRFFDKWKKYIANLHGKREKLQDAANYRQRVIVRSHFYAWSTFVGFSAQKEARTCATQLFYFQVWRRVVLRRCRERQYLTLFGPLKKYHCLTKWRRRVVGLRQTQSAACTVMQVNRCNALMVLFCIKNDSRWSFIRSWKRWRSLVHARQLWRQWIAVRWGKRSVSLKRTCFIYWRSFVDRTRKRASRVEKHGVSLALRESTKDLLAEHSSLVIKMNMQRVQKTVIHLTSQITALDIEGTVPDPRVALEAVLSKDLSSPLSDFVKDEANSHRQFVQWRKLTTSRDVPLLSAAVSLLISNFRTASRRSQFEASRGNKLISLALSSSSRSPSIVSDMVSTRSVRSPTSKGSPANSKAAVAENTLWCKMAMMLVGDPIYNSKKTELCVGCVEAHVREEALRSTVLRIKSDQRDGRILAKIEARFAAFRYYNVCPFFSMADPSDMHPGHSPFQFMMEEYDNIVAEKKNLHSSRSHMSSKRAKYKIPLPPLPPERRLPFLLRQHFREYIGVRAESIRLRHLFRARVARAVLLAKYIRIAIELSPLDTPEKRLQVAAKVSTDEIHSLKCKRTLMSFHKSLASRLTVDFAKQYREHKFSILDLLGFNPQFLRGGTRTDLRRNRRLRRFMAAQGKALAEVGLSQKKRRYSLIDLHQLEVCLDRADLLASGGKRRNSISISTRHRTLLQQMDDDAAEEKRRKETEDYERQHQQLLDNIEDVRSEFSCDNRDASPSVDANAGVGDALDITGADDVDSGLPEEGEETFTPDSTLDATERLRPASSAAGTVDSQKEKLLSASAKIHPDEKAPDGGAPGGAPDAEDTDRKVLDAEQVPSSLEQHPATTTNASENNQNANDAGADGTDGPLRVSDTKAIDILDVNLVAREQLQDDDAFGDSDDLNEEDAVYLSRDKKGRRRTRKSAIGGGDDQQPGGMMPRRRRTTNSYEAGEALRMAGAGDSPGRAGASGSNISRRRRLSREEEELERQQRAFPFTVLDFSIPKMDNVPLLWDSDDGRKTIRSSERLLELSARYGAVLQHTSAAHLEKLKEEVLEATTGEPGKRDVDRTGAQAQTRTAQRTSSPPRPLLPRQIVSAPSLTAQRRTASPPSRQRTKKDRLGVQDTQLFFSPSVTMQQQQQQQQRPQSTGIDSQGLGRTGDHAGVGVASHPQLRVPYNFRGKDVARTYLAMESTAALFNVGGTDAFPLDVSPAREADEEERRLLRRRNVNWCPPERWSRPWLASRVPSVRVVESFDGAVERPVQPARTPDVVPATHDSLLHDSPPMAHEDDDFTRWLRSVKMMARAPQSRPEALEVLAAERRLLQRQAESVADRLRRDSTSIPKELRVSLRATRDAAIGHIFAIDEVSALIASEGEKASSMLHGHSVVPTRRPSSRQGGGDALPARMRTEVSRARRPFASAESPLSDVETSRLVEYLMNAS